MLLLFYIYAALAKRKLKNQLVRACQWRNRGSRLFVLHCVLFLLSHSRSVLKQLYDLFIIHPLYTLCMIILNNTYIITLWKMGPWIVRRRKYRCRWRVDVERWRWVWWCWSRDQVTNSYCSSREPLSHPLTIAVHHDSHPQWNSASPPFSSLF